MPHTVVGIIDPFHPRILEAIASGLPEGWTLNVAKSQSDKDRAVALQQADIAFVMAAQMPAALLSAAPKLRFIQKLGAGVDRIDLDYCAAHGIAVARLQAGNSIPVAEHTLLLMLAACRRLPYLDRQTRAGNWDKEAARGVSRQIHGRTVGIVGFGAIGKAVARLLTGFGATVLYYDPQRSDATTERELNVSFASLDEVTALADILSLHLPLTRATANLFDAARIARLKSGVIIINCARGGIVDEAALHAALLSGQVYATGIDVFTHEPPAGNPLLELDQTVVTPHSAGGTIDNFDSVLRRAVENTRHFLDGRALPERDVVLPAPTTAA